MIGGRFEDGVPSLEVTVWCNFPRVRRQVTFLMDTSTTQSTVLAADLGLDPSTDFPLDDRVVVEVSDTLFASGILLRTLLSLDSDDGSTHLEEATVLATDSDLKYSRLGRDILNRWLMLYDPPGDQLLFEPTAS